MHNLKHAVFPTITLSSVVHIRPLFPWVLRTYTSQNQLTAVVPTNYLIYKMSVLGHLILRSVPLVEHSRSLVHDELEIHLHGVGKHKICPVDYDRVCTTMLIAFSYYGIFLGGEKSKWEISCANKYSTTIRPVKK